MDEKKKAFIAILLAILLWALTYPLIKISVVSIPPMTLAFLRALSAALFLLLIVKFQKKEKGLVEILQKNKITVLILGASGVLFYQLTQNFGLKFTLASTAGAIVGITPLMSFVLAILFLKEAVTPKKVIGSTICAVGVLLIFFGGQDISILFSSDYFLGNVLMLLNTLSFAVFSVYSKNLMVNYDETIVTLASYLAGTLLLFPVIFILGDFSGIFALPLSSWLTVLFLGIFCSGIAYLLWNYGLKNMEVSNASIFLYLLNIMIIIFGVLLLGERLTEYLITGAALILIGVFIVEKH